MLTKNVSEVIFSKWVLYQFPYKSHKVNLDKCSVEGVWVGEDCFPQQGAHLGWFIRAMMLVCRKCSWKLSFVLDFRPGLPLSWKQPLKDYFTSSLQDAVAAAAKSLQSCPTLCNPIDGSPPGSPIPGILQARTLEWVAISFSIAGKWKVKVKLLSHVRLSATPWTAAYQAPPSKGFSKQE